jgi:hypothetical protein
MVSESGHFSELFNVAASRPAKSPQVEVDYARYEACVKGKVNRDKMSPHGLMLAGAGS